MSGRRARHCEVAKRAARVRLVVRLHTICPFVNVLVTYSLAIASPPPKLRPDFGKRASLHATSNPFRTECYSARTLFERWLIKQAALGAGDTLSDAALEATLAEDNLASPAKRPMGFAQPGWRDRPRGTIPSGPRSGNCYH